jgi:hypothetical protein
MGSLVPVWDSSPPPPLDPQEWEAPSKEEPRRVAAGALPRPPAAVAARRPSLARASAPGRGPSTSRTPSVDIRAATPRAALPTPVRARLEASEGGGEAPSATAAEALRYKDHWFERVDSAPLNDHPDAGDARERHRRRSFSPDDPFKSMHLAPARHSADAAPPAGGGPTSL